MISALRDKIFMMTDDGLAQQTLMLLDYTDQTAFELAMSQLFVEDKSP